MNPHKHKFNFLSNKLDIVCNCQFIPSKDYCRLKDFIEQSPNLIQKQINKIDRIYSNIKCKKKLLDPLKKISSLIYDLVILKGQIQNKNISLGVKYMNYFIDFHVDYEKNFKIISNFKSQIMIDFAKIIQSHKINQSNIKMTNYHQNFQTIQIEQINQKIQINEIYKDEQYYLQLNLNQKYAFQLQLGKQSLIEIIQNDLWDKTNKIILNFWNGGEEVFLNKLIAFINQDYLFGKKKQLFYEEKILISSIVEESFNVENQTDFNQIDYNDLKKKTNLLDVKKILNEQNQICEVFFLNPIIHLIDQRLNQIYHSEELTSTQLFQYHDLFNNEEHYSINEEFIEEQSIYNGEFSINNQEQIINEQQSNDRGQLNSNIFIQPLQHQFIFQNNYTQIQNQNYHLYITQSLLNFFENQPNFQIRCYDFYLVQWKVLNLMNNLESFQEIADLNDLIDLENNWITLQQVNIQPFEIHQQIDLLMD